MNGMLCEMAMRKGIIFIGAPGCGKGTFGKIIESKVSWPHISLGDLMRNEVAISSSLGIELQRYMKSGQLVPDEVADTMAIQKIKSLDRKINCFVLDGYPRTVNQAAALEATTTTDSSIQYFAINVNLEKWVAVEKMLARVSCKTCKGNFNTADICTDGYHMPAILPDRSTCKLGRNKCNPELVKRDDDEREIIEKRWEEYSTVTAPLLDFYRQKGRLWDFQVKRGVQDTDDLIDLMKTVSQSS